MQKKFFTLKNSFCFVIIICFICGTLSAEITENFRNFLYSNGEFISKLAHPTNDYIESYVNSDDYLLITSKSNFTDSRQKLKIYISEDFQNFEIISDDSFILAFAALELIKDVFVDIIKDFREDTSHSEEQNQLALKFLNKIGEMDGQQLAYVIVLIKWIDY